MELLMIGMIGILAFIFVKYLYKKLLLCLFILAFASIISFIYKTPYSICVFLIVILAYAIKSVFSEVKYLGGNIIRPCRLYFNGMYEKLVLLLFSINYIVFMSICYFILMCKSVTMIDIIELGATFSLTWICIWFVGNLKYTLFKYVDSQA